MTTDITKVEFNYKELDLNKEHMDSHKDFISYLSNLNLVDCESKKRSADIVKIAGDDKVILCDKTVKNVVIKPISLSKTQPEDFYNYLR